MRLSEALRLGATLHRQTFGRLYTRNSRTGEIVATCAMGSVLAACGTLDVSNSYSELPEEIHASLLTEVMIPDLAQPVRIDSAIVYFNDCKYWTRERIADWVEIQENTAPQLLKLLSARQEVPAETIQEEVLA